eukprot:311828-Pyramimonas_sp.AAC.1
MTLSVTLAFPKSDQECPSGASRLRGKSPREPLGARGLRGESKTGEKHGMKLSPGEAWKPGRCGGQVAL